MRRTVLLVTLALGVALALMVSHPVTGTLMRYVGEAPVLVVPVQGVSPGALRSSWGEPRSGGRSHQGIDIFARRGTPVLAAAGGEVVRIGYDRLGGNVVWVAGQGARLYYYAHLERVRADLRVGDLVVAGCELGLVGTTGNAAGTPPHLHFGIYPLWHGLVPIDPAPVLKARGKTVRAWS